MSYHSSQKLNAEILLVCFILKHVSAKRGEGMGSRLQGLPV